ncbi:MAG: leucine-rich repeat domain-containing protein [Clostridia bacterium]|nr:leucine-rich repeat domain-containing protein [Clostridia bacterium]
MKKTNKILSVFLALIMVISIIPMSSITASAETYSGNCGSNLTWTYDSETYTLTISGTGAMYNYYNSNDIPWYMYSYNIKTIVINEGVTTIGAMAFCNCKYVTDIPIPDSVTSIGMGAFIGCTSLTNMTIPDSVTSIGSQAFIECTSLTSATIPENVTTIGEGPFAGCTSLVEITVDNNNQHYSNDEDGILFNKDKTRLVQYPAGNTRTRYAIPDGITTIDAYAFSLCENISVVAIPNSVKTIGLAAFQCPSLSAVYYSGTEKEWSEIDFTSYNEPLLLSSIHFNHTEHTDNDNDGSCDECGKSINPKIACDHNCHKGGISGFFWKITNFFNKIFGLKKYCECGVAHY